MNIKQIFDHLKKSSIEEMYRLRTLNVTSFYNHLNLKAKQNVANFK